jgi:integrase
VLSIKRTVVQYDTIVEKEKTKNLSSKRSYPLTPEISAILQELKSVCEENKKFFGKEFVDNGYIFTYPDGSMLRPDYVSHRLRKLIERNAFPYIRFHDLRHTCASVLLSKGWTLKDISEWLGHSDIGITANIYTHVDIARKQKLAENIAHTFQM